MTSSTTSFAHPVDVIATADDGLPDHDTRPAELEEPPARRQPGVLVELYVEGQDPYRVRITNRERLAFEKTAARHKEWPTAAAGQHFAMTFVCWAAAKRAGHTALTFEQFQDALEDYELVEDVPADPTR